MSQIMLCSLGESVALYNTNNNNPSNDTNNNRANSPPVPTIYRCRAPIASIEFMEELSETMGNSRQLTPGLRYRNLGKSGLRVSNIGLGAWVTFGGAVSETEAEAVVEAAYLAGINLFDLSEAHTGLRAELMLGQILKRKPWPRTSYIVCTKIYFNSKSDERGLSRKHIIESVKASLLRLQLDYIDVVILHKCDPMCPTEETVRAMHHVITQGWVMYWGTAKWTPVEIMDAYSNCRQFNCITPIIEQAEYHMFCREKTELYMSELYNKIGVGLMAWSPIGMGLVSPKTDDSNARVLTQSALKHNKYTSFSWSEDETLPSSKDSTRDGCWSKERPSSLEKKEAQTEKLKQVELIAERLGCSLTQLSIAWCSKNESVQCLLLGATTVQHLYHCIHSLQLVPKLNTTVMSELEKVLGNKPARAPMVSTLALR
ncbi:Potassium channel [Nesidiocoris tenuis]|uniref:Potassium channel n=1 Tax=Nesidiocoris tenuis TaxID=355587 RepID=A0ABN7B9K3_9HEMI|nr:Potassium channel [Nesidiocoris tenuis]